MAQCWQAGFDVHGVLNPYPRLDPPLGWVTVRNFFYPRRTARLYVPVIQWPR